MSDQQSDVLIAQRLPFLGLLGAQLLAPGLEATQLAAQLIDSRRAGRLGHRPFLEGAKVAIERFAGLLRLGIDPGDLLLALRSLGFQFIEGRGDRLAHQRLAFEHRQKLGEDRLLQLIGRQPVAVAGVFAVALAGEADVVAIAPAVALGRGADVALAAARAFDQAGEQILRAVGAPQGDVLAALAQHFLGTLEEVGVDQRLVRGGVVGTAKEDLPDVGAVPQDAKYAGDVERLAGAGPQAALSHPGGERR